jgi:hypothetical protein
MNSVVMLTSIGTTMFFQCLLHMGLQTLIMVGLVQHCGARLCNLKRQPSSGSEETLERRNKLFYSRSRTSIGQEAP